MAIDVNHSSSSAEHSTQPSADGVRTSVKTRHWIYACLLLLGVTWAPLLSIHLHRTALADADAGTAVVIFPPTVSTAALFRRVLDANGALVRPVPWLGRAWIVQSREPGFVGRLKSQGAWGVYSPELLSANALFNCLRPARASAERR